MHVGKFFQLMMKYLIRNQFNFYCNNMDLRLFWYEIKIYQGFQWLRSNQNNQRNLKMLTKLLFIFTNTYGLSNANHERTSDYRDFEKNDALKSNSIDLYYWFNCI